VMHEREKSDSAEVAKKPANKAGQPAAERVERRAEAEGNTGELRTRRTLRRARVSQWLARVRQTVLALPLLTRGGSPVRELRTPGSVRGVPGNGYPYRDQLPLGKQHRPLVQPLVAQIDALELLRCPAHPDTPPCRVVSGCYTSVLKLCVMGWVWPPERFDWEPEAGISGTSHGKCPPTRHSAPGSGSAGADARPAGTTASAGA